MIRLHQNCDELSKWNFDKIIKTNDLRFLVVGYDGYEQIEIPEDAKKVWENIQEEYLKKTENDKTLGYFELVADIADLKSRAHFADIMIKQLAERSFLMSNEIRKEYISELKAIRFYINEGKPLKGEILKLINQLKAVKMKLELKTKEAKEFENASEDNKGASTLTLKVKIQRALKVNIDLRNTSVSEWLLWIDEVINNKAA